MPSRTFSSPALLSCSLASLLLACALASSQGATVEISAPAGQDSVAAIQKAIDGSAEGDTIHFGPGTYELTKTVVFKPGRNYTGSGATLKQGAAKTFAAKTEDDKGHDIVVRGLTFDGGGLAFAGSGKVKARNVQVLDCSFVNVTDDKYPFGEGIYDPIGASSCRIVGNNFRNVTHDNGIATWNIEDCEITDNRFDGVVEGMHLNGLTTNTQVLRNTGIHMHRMGIEIQGKDNVNLVVEDNYFAEWVSPYNDSFGLSIVPSSGPNISVRYNTMLGRPPVPGTWTNRFGFGYELGGDVTCRDNFSEGWWWIGIVIGGKRTVVENNVLRGPKGGEYTTPTKITLEPGSEKETETIGKNTQTITDAYVEGPNELTAKLANGRVDLSWVDRSSGKAGFAVQRRAPGGDYRELARLAPKTAAYRDESFDGKSDAVYRLQAFDDAGNLTYSPAVIVHATTPAR
jgi:Right handed beta helix region